MRIAKAGRFPNPLPISFRLNTFIFTVVLVLVAVAVLYPILIMVVQSFQSSLPGQPVEWSFAGWNKALTEPGMFDSVVNTFKVSLVRQGLAFLLAVPIAYVLARTNLPGKHWLEFLFWIALLIPGLVVTIAWILLLDPDYGLINEWVQRLPFIDGPIFDIYSYWGIILVFTASTGVAFKVVLLTPAFMNMDAALEDASRVSGASNLGTVARIFVPVMGPAILVLILMAFIHSLQTFEIELILGSPSRFFVFGTKIFDLIRDDPPQYPAATAIGTMIMISVLPLIILYRWYSGRRRFTTVGGQYRSNLVELRKWKWPIFAGILALGLLATVAPLILLVVGSFMNIFGFFNIRDTWTLTNWTDVLTRDAFITSLRNTLIVSGGAALVASLGFSIIAYVTVRTRFFAREALNLMTWMPLALPGIILGLGVLAMVLGNPLLRPIYGTHYILIGIAAVSGMTLSVQMLQAVMRQISFELEEASIVTGASWLQTYRWVVLPIITPSMIAVGLLVFILTSRNVSSIALLGTRNTRPLSLLQMDYLLDGKLAEGAVIGTVMVVITVGVALVARAFGFRVGLRS